MMNVDIRALAKLARLEITDAEVQKLENELPAILEFVEKIQKAPVSSEIPDHSHRNIMREDAHSHESGIFTNALLKAAPATKNGRVVVKQVISRKKN